MAGLLEKWIQRDRPRPTSLRDTRGAGKPTTFNELQRKWDRWEEEVNKYTYSEELAG